ncbi:alpha-xylosidase [Paenactinomyces guangxiensis]|uniref:alpha-D-xyloside xylohydrolase n=1 Tax=Paenactinomyces guangxiensis TaxID=1490290 RepID=A0A7W1WQ28_9BACL|nr:alpha-xylosidase [Paenactinomyces guangxiensis]MBA4493828.1 alpha-xylosidase [Paenactinomyces guangxiensis]MBH8591294.1 alpha-xylosidase [Paenactinomyces guangxiensis]
MKFSDGQWLTRKEYKITSVVEVHEIMQNDRSLTILASPRHILDRSGQLDTPLLELNISAPMQDVIRVQIDHHKGGRERGPRFAVRENKDHAVSIAENQSVVSLTSGDLTVKVQKEGNWEITFEYRGEKITSSGYKSIAHILSQDGKTYMREQLDLEPDEYIYGLGERFTPFVKNGQTVDIWNRDGGTNTEQAYKNIPFYLSNKGYGVFVNHPERVSFEVASEYVSKVQFSVSGEHLDYYLIGGPSMKKVIENYTELTGKPALPPAWTFGLWLSTSFTTNYDEATVNQFIDGMSSRDLPVHVFHFDCFWMKEFEWCNFKWDERIFPEPEQMLQRLKAKGLKICVWINPYIAQRSCLFDEAKEHGYLLKKENGDVWQWDLWQPGMGIVDFTNPHACEWYADKLRSLIRMGVDCFKTDFGERIPTDVVYFDGSDPMKMHNYYTFLYNKVVFDVLEEEKGKGEAVLFARSATVGSQQFPVHWGGDCTATYPSMAESLRGGLSLGMSGFGFWSHDIGGFESNSTADVYKRWIAFGLLSSHSRLHGSKSYRVPWLYDEESVDVLRFFTRLKCRLMPYLYSKAIEASETGVPMMRSMVLEFNGDPACAYLDRQYMLGESLLVAPVFNEKGLAHYYLPEGKWTHLLTGEKADGGVWRKEHHDYLSLPLYVRPNSVIAMGAVDNQPDYNYADGVEFHIFELEEGNRVTIPVYSEKGNRELLFTAARESDVISIEVAGANKHWSVQLRGMEQVASVIGAEVQADTFGVKLIPNEKVTRIEVRL